MVVYPQEVDYSRVANITGVAFNQENMACIYVCKAKVWYFIEQT